MDSLRRRLHGPSASPPQTFLSLPQVVRRNKSAMRLFWVVSAALCWTLFITFNPTALSDLTTPATTAAYQQHPLSVQSHHVEPATLSASQLLEIHRSTGYMCDRCLVRPDLCGVYGTKNVDLSRGYDGTGTRWRHVMEKAGRGEEIKMGVLGGSVSLGHGCDCTTWHALVADWWNTTFPGPLTHYDGSVGARGSDYFKFCHKEHIPQDVDIILLEFAVNDWDRDEKSFNNFETLLRTVIEYPSAPAVLIYDWLKLDSILSTGADAQHGLAQYYDVPVVNLRNVVLPFVMDDTTRIREIFVYKDHQDLVHPSKVGHQMSADMVILYLEQQLCQLKHRPVIPPSTHSHITQDADQVANVIPRVRLSNRLTDAAPHKVEPMCASVDSLTSPLKPLLDQTKGFVLHQQSADKWFWRGEEAGAEIAFEVETTMPEAEITIYILKSKKFQLGEMDCWIDDAFDRRTFIPAWWDNTMSIGEFYKIQSPDVKPGKHIVRCRILDRGGGWDESKGTAINIIGLFVI